ncbi:MAG: hypothetical protein KKD92_06460 [Proteobacteria bacterium]|nr:hypothetical protein [Pseudomonadota bacterium]
MGAAFLRPAVKSLSVSFCLLLIKSICLALTPINGTLFSTRNEALAAGYRPCGFCRP